MTPVPGLRVLAFAIMSYSVAGAARAAAAPQATNCTDVQVGSAQSYDCINAQLGAAAAATPRSSSADAPLTSSSPSNVVGTFNEGATRNRLGQNFGKSAIPYRPAPANPPALPPPR
jgi:hypothetical protein